MPSTYPKEAVSWQARWIWLPDAPTQAQTTMQFRKVFDWQPAGPARLLIAASHIYRVYLNGALVGRGPDRADPRWPYYDVYDIAALLRGGKNVLCGLAHHFQPQPGIRSWCLYAGAPGFLAQVESGGRVLAATDDHWRVRAAPGWRPCAISINRFRAGRHEFDCAGYQDLQAALAGDYDDSGWPAAAPAGPWPEPLPPEIPPLQPELHAPCNVGITQPHPDAIAGWRELRGRPEAVPMRVNPTPEGAWITLDYGRPMGGFPVLKLAAEGRGTLDLYCGEGDTWLLTDRLLLAPTGPVDYMPLDWRGGQRLGLHFRELTAPVSVQRAEFMEMVYPFETRGAFRCADDNLTKIWRVCRETAWAGIKDHPVDCLNREQALWLADITVHNRALAACFGDIRPTVKAMRQALRGMNEAGIVPVPGPSGLGYLLDGPTLNWSEMTLTLAITLADVCRFNPDRDLLAWAWPRLQKIMAHFQQYADARGLLDNQRPGLPELKCFGGWNPMLKSGVTCAFNGEYVIALRAAAELARAAGAADQALDWSAQAHRAVLAMRTAFWDNQRHLFSDGETAGQRLTQFSPTANAWAALAGALLPEQAGAWAEALRTAADLMPSQTPFDATLLLESYLRYDLDLHARKLLDDYWGAMVREGHATLPEFWHTGYRGGLQFRATSSSLCHPFGAGPAFLALEYILGLQPLAAGWRQARVRPHALGLTWAQGRMPTPLGEVEIAWEKSDARWEMEIRLPAGLTAEVVLPLLSWGRERLLVNRREVWRTDPRKEYQAQLERKFTAGGPREVRTSLDQPGRYLLVLESI